MELVFFGTPDFAVPSLEILFRSKHTVKAVVTAPDKERGRGQRISFTPVKEFALKNDIELLQPGDLKSPDFISRLKGIDAGLFVVVAFRILPEEVFTLPQSGSINLHASLLPKYRGAAPIQWSLINGETKTGVTTFFLKKKVDTGNLILQRETEIDQDDNLGTLHDKLSKIGAEVVLDTVDMIERGTIETIEQDGSAATPAPKIRREDCEIDWSKNAEDVHNLIRGLSPVPGAFFVRNGKLYKIFKSEFSNKTSLKPGEFYRDNGSLYAGCGSGSIEIFEIQPEGRKRMSASEFLRGYNLP